MNQILTGDALEVLRTLPSESVHCIVTSPPYYALRDYGVAGQIGLEETPAAFVAKLVEVFHEARRVLRSDGTCWINLGDSYCSQAGPQTEQTNTGKDGAQKGAWNGQSRKPASGFKPKDLMMIPARVAIALQENGWWLRSDVIWHKLTAMPESVEDRPTSAHEHLFLLAKSERYFYDADAIREPLRPKTLSTFGCTFIPTGNDALGKVKGDNWNRSMEERKPRLAADGQPAGANKRNVWPIAAQPYPEAHFATMPPKLVEPCILAGTSPRACEHCGAPWLRQVERTPMVISNGPKSGGYGSRTTDSLSGTMVAPAETRSVGWQPTCTCKNTGSGKCVVLDPFMGAGTTALVSLRLGRQYLGIELNPAYVTLAEKRISEVQPTLWVGGVA